MSFQAPPPPKVNAKFVDAFGVIHHVRSIVDYEDTPEGPFYHVVFRFRPSGRRGWRYLIDSCRALTYGIYRPYCEKLQRPERRTRKLSA
jgi:hypothetical protein